MNLLIGVVNLIIDTHIDTHIDTLNDTHNIAPAFLLHNISVNYLS